MSASVNPALVIHTGDAPNAEYALSSGNSTTPVSRTDHPYLGGSRTARLALPESREVEGSASAGFADGQSATTDTQKRGAHGIRDASPLALFSGGVTHAECRVG
jgi:hypothetical protein